MEEILFTNGKHTDNRGTLYFFKELDLKEVKRMYILEHPDLNSIRAWQGHKYEKKWFSVISGSFKIVLVKPDDWYSPSNNLFYKEYYLTETESQVLYVPGGFATGFKAETPGSKLMVFSDQSLEESKDDDYRFEKNRWYDWNLQSEQ